MGLGEVVWRVAEEFRRDEEVIVYSDPEPDDA